MGTAPGRSSAGQRRGLTWRPCCPSPQASFRAGAARAVHHDRRRVEETPSSPPTQMPVEPQGELDRGDGDDRPRLARPDGQFDPGSRGTGGRLQSSRLLDASEGVGVAVDDQRRWEIRRRSIKPRKPTNPATTEPAPDGSISGTEPTTPEFASNQA